MPDRKTKAQIDTVLADVYTEFARLNSTHFNCSLRTPKIEFSLRKTFGGYYRKRDHLIVLSWQAYVEHGWDETLNTFRHEVAHIIHMDHQRAFWELAATLGVARKYAKTPIKKRSGRLLFYECPACKTRITRRRRIRNSSCARCDSKYNPAFRLTLVEEAVVHV